MPEIGQTLREARMRARIDISEIEAETKIRAKYLRALENEEWDLLPGPTFVKTFLRTYAEALGLDAKLLVEEYKVRHERPSEHDLRPIVPPSASRRRKKPARAIPRGYTIWGAVLLLLAALFFIDRGTSNHDANNPSTSTTTSAKAPATTHRRAKHHATAKPVAPRKPKLATLRIIPTGTVYVCLKAKGGETLVGGLNLAPGATQRTYRRSGFRLQLGNSSAKLVVNGKTLTVPDTPNGIGYSITRAGRHVLPTARYPSCG